MSTQVNLTFAVFPKTKKEIDDTSLAGSTLSNDRHLALLGYPKRQMIQSPWYIMAIPKAHVLEGKIQSLRFGRIYACILYCRFPLDHLCQSIRGRTVLCQMMRD